MGLKCSFCKKLVDTIYSHIIVGKYICKDCLNNEEGEDNE